MPKDISVFQKLKNKPQRFLCFYYFPLFYEISCFLWNWDMNHNYVLLNLMYMFNGRQFANVTDDIWESSVHFMLAWFDSGYCDNALWAPRFKCHDCAKAIFSLCQSELVVWQIIDFSFGCLVCGNLFLYLLMKINLPNLCSTFQVFDMQ